MNNYTYLSHENFKPMSNVLGLEITSKFENLATVRKAQTNIYWIAMLCGTDEEREKETKMSRTDVFWDTAVSVAKEGHNAQK